MYQTASSFSPETEPSRKFGKQIQRQQLDLPEYAASFLNYKALKKVWRKWDLFAGSEC